MRPILALLLLAGCGATPQHFEPGVAPAANGAFRSAGEPGVAPDAVPGDWWRLYRDPVLDGLVADALTANRDLAAAAANLARVRATLSEARTARLPGTTVSGSIQRGQQSTAGFGGLPGVGDERTTYDAGIDVAYELDLFGRVGNLVAAARADTDAARAALDAARVSVVGETARAYTDACSSAVRLGVARRTLALQDDSLRLVTRIRDVGRGNGLDVARAQAVRDSAAAAVPLIEAERAAALFRLATLTGRTPAEVPAAAAACSAVPRLAMPVPVGDGAGLLRRRPDIRQAERELAAATARVGVATADLFPRISLGGSAGTTALAAGDLGSSGTFRWSLGPLISWSFPNIAVARARIRQAEASAQAAVARFDGTVLGALEETETALSNYGRELDRQSALRSARDAAATAARLARKRFENGADSFLSLLDAERTLADAEATLAASDARVAGFQITLFKALGGGWQTDAAGDAVPDGNLSGTSTAASRPGS